MLCAMCGQDGAKAYMRQTKDGQKSVCLCSACYRKLYGKEPARPETTAETSTDRACPSCGRTLGEFKKTGLLGCADCYKAFRDDLVPIVKFTQGRLHHTGKDPDLTLKGEEEELREELKVARERGDVFMEERIRYRLAVIHRLLSGGEE